MNVTPELFAMDLMIYGGDVFFRQVGPDERLRLNDLWRRCFFPSS